MLKLVVSPSGSLEFIYSDSLRDLLGEGVGKISRASYVEPLGTSWQADLAPVGGPILGPFETRGVALEAELEWLNNHTDTWKDVNRGRD